MEPLMTIRDVMELTRLSKAKVYQLKDRGILPAVRLPGCTKVLFHPEDVRGYLEAGRTTAAGGTALTR
jgi:excisionase family DNA binding protein